QRKLPHILKPPRKHVSGKLFPKLPENFFITGIPSLIKETDHFSSSVIDTDAGLQHSQRGGSSLNLSQLTPVCLMINLVILPRHKDQSAGFIVSSQIPGSVNLLRIADV